MNSSSSRRLPLITAALIFLASCALFQPKGEIVVQVVSWPLVKKYAEPGAGLPGQKVTVQKTEDHRLVAEQTTDASGVLVFKVPAGSYVVHSIGNEAETVNVKSGRSVNLQFVQH
jgi:hypothetical protein